MAVLQPREVFRVLGAHRVRYVVIGNLGGALYGSPLVTHDVDLCPSRDEQNLVALAAALEEMGARIRTPDAAEGVPFACDASFLRQMTLLNLTTRFGDVDLSFEPAGTGGYDDLKQRATRIEFKDGLISSNAMRGRPKSRVPTLVRR
jgi:hypothetical protein